MTDQTSPDDTPKDVPTPQQPDANGAAPALPEMPALSPEEIKANSAAVSSAYGEGSIQILEGLEPGELVVTEGAVFVSNRAAAGSSAAD